MFQEKLNNIFQQNHDFRFYISQQSPQYLQSLGLLAPESEISSSTRAYVNLADETTAPQDLLISQIMVSIAFSSTVVSAILIKLKGGKATLLNAVLLIIAISAMAVYQYQSIFEKELQDKFMPYSTVFLSLNLLLFVLFAYINKIQKGKGINEFFQKNFPQSGKPIDRNRGESLDDEIKQQGEDEKYKVSSEDLHDVITPLKVNKDDLQATFGGTIENKTCLMLLKFLFLLSSVGVLALYAYIMYKYDNGNLLGMIIAISVFFLDCFNILRQANSENDVNTVFFMILNRIFLVSLDKNYWLYGFMVLYMIYGSTLALQVAERRFPFDKDIAKKNFLGIHPSIFAFILTAVYFVLIYLVNEIHIEGVEIYPLKFKEGQEVLDKLPASILSVFACLTVYVIVSLARLFIRKAHKTQKESGYASCANRLGCNHGLFSLTNLFILLAFGSFVFWVSIMYHYTKNTSLVIWGVTIPLIAIFYANGFAYLVLNDYSYLQNVTQLNKEIDVHNLRVLRNEKYKELIEQQIKENKLFIVDLPVVHFQPKQKLVFTEEEGKNLQAFQAKIKEFYTQQKDLKEGLIDKTIKSEEALDPTKTYLDIDEVAESQQGWHQTNDIRFKRVKDWRKDSSCCSAFFSRNLRPNDKGFIYNMILAFLAWLSLLISLLSYQGQGVELVYPILYLGISLVIASSVIYQSRAFLMKEIVPWTILNLIYIGSLAGYFTIKFKDGIKTPGALSYIFFQLLGVPTAVHGLVVLLRIIDRGVDKLSDFYFFIGIFIIGQISIMVCCFILIQNKNAGIIYLAFVLFTIYAIRTVITYIRNGYELTNVQKYVFCFAALCFSMTPAVLSFGITSLKPKQGLTYSTFIFFIMVSVYSVGKWIKDFNQSETKPVFCSRYLFPIYKFNRITKDLEPHNGPTYAWFLSLIVLLAWSVYYNSMSQKKQIGASLSVIIETLILVSAMLFSAQTVLLIDDANYKIDEVTFKQTWLELKKRFFKEINASQTSTCDSYYNLWMKEYFLKSYSQVLNGQSPDEIPQIISEELKDDAKFEAGNLESQKQYFQNKVQEIFSDKGSQLSDLSSVLIILSDLQQKVQKSYEKEIQLIIRIVILSFYNSIVLKEYEMQKFVRFIKDKEGIFFAFGIKITITPSMSILEQYEQALTQIEFLNPEDRANFDKIKLAADTEKAREEEVRKKLAELELSKHLARLREAAEKNRQRQKDYEKQREEIQKDINKDPNGMPDCIEKYQRIVERAKQGMGKFRDSDFRADSSCLKGGKDGRSNHPSRGSFVSFSSESFQDFKIFKDSAKYTEAVQGSIGDCYFVAACAALGNKRARERFYFFENEDEWKTCGAFCVKFGAKGNENWIVIDDYFLCQTLQSNQTWGDGSSEPKPELMQPKDGEIWACVLEKAYAKMNEGYGNIRGGNVHLALEELIGGEAVNVWLQREVRDKNSFYEEVKEFIEKQYPIGCASHQGQGGDSNAGPSGIPYRHAYTVVDVKMLDQNKLMCIRNPWGKSSQKQNGTIIGEFNGDWSDYSPLWTERFKNMVNFEKADDGIWWMEVGDFLEEFSCLQYCIPPSNE